MILGAYTTVPDACWLSSVSDTTNKTVLFITGTALFYTAYTTVPDTYATVSDTYILIQNQVAVLHLKEMIT
jgi:hypothetical protein